MSRMSLTKKIIIATAVSILFIGLLYSFVVPFVMNYSDRESRSFWVKMSSVLALLSPIAVVIVYLFIRPIKTALAQIDGGAVPDREALYRARRACINVSAFLFIVGATAYFAGTIINFSVEWIQDHTFNLGHFISRCSLAVSSGVLNGVVSARLINIFLIEAKVKMNIFSLDDRVKGEKMETIRGRLLLPGVLLFVYIVVFSMVSFTNHQKTNLARWQQSAVELADKVRNGSLDSAGFETGRKAFLDESDRAVMSSIWKMAVIMLTILTVTIILFTVVAIEVQMHIDKLNRQVRRMAGGDMDLSKRVNIISFDDIGVMTSGINSIIENLSRTFVGIKKISGAAYAASQTTGRLIAESRTKAGDLGGQLGEAESSTRTQVEVIRRAVDSISTMMGRVENSISRIGEQTMAVEHTSIGMKKMVESFDTMARAAMRSESTFRELAKAIESGNEELAKSLQATYEINEVSARVNDILKIIADIADQSNVLAMNAAIESSHAGEYGKGFAIVADEIRKLAESTFQSAKTIESLVSEMKNKNSRGMDISENLKRVFHSLTDGMANTGRTISEIAAYSKEQAGAATENLKDIEKLLLLTDELRSDTVTQKKENGVVDGSVRKLNETSEKLLAVNSNLVSGLRSIVASFENLSANFEATFKSMAELEERISSYKLE